ncbi:hypothetical protein [Brevibacillus choshinensis]|uniref:Uncharacterized protein n=1 Tax=Brevibacillus choshinensis TaxID=54911 RepID=A0ABX7FR82_BRECH|nr:hypothetical protein [Brevibacillus choshinensis]QRG68109.1 hypothetical protein JNE38_02550 [Brevibacillus choshinensis]
MQNEQSGRYSRSRSRSRGRARFALLRDQIIGSVFLVGVALSMWGQPATTYSWMWQEIKDTGHDFAVGLLDISSSSFASEWQVMQGGNQVVDLSKMIPGDARQIKATLSRGASDLDFHYKIVARVKDTGTPGAAQKLEEVLRMRITEGSQEVVYDGLVRDLHQEQPGIVRANGTEGDFSANEGDKSFFISVYLPAEGVDHSYQSLSGELELRFLAKQATPNAIFAE